MTVQNWLARISGKTKSLSPEEAELHKLSEAGDEARREGQPEIALGYYQQGLELSRKQGSLFGEEIFLGLIGALQTDRGRYEEAEQALGECITVTERIGDPARRARAMGNLGAHYLQRGLLVKAQSVLEQALALARTSGDLMVLGLTLANQGAVYLKQDNPTYAMRLLREAVERLQGQPGAFTAGSAGYALGLFGQANVGIGETERGFKLLSQAIRLAQQNKDARQELKWSSALAAELSEVNKLPEALKLYERCDELASTMTPPPPDYVEGNLISRASVHNRMGQQDMALSFAQRALEQARRDANRPVEADAQTLMGQIYREMGQLPRAIEALEAAQALHLSGVIENPEQRTEIQLTLGALYQQNNDPERAMQQFNGALEMAGDNNPEQRARALRRIGNAYQEQGAMGKALEFWVQALDLFERSGQYALAARVVCDIGAARRSIAGIKSALPDYERATMLLSNVKDPATRGLVLSNVANLYTDLGEVETAASFFQESIQIARQLADRRSETLRLGNYAWFHIATGKPAEAIRQLEEALSISRPMGERVLIAVQTNNLAQAYHAQRDYATARGLYRQALTLVDTPPEPRWRAAFQSNLAKTALAEGQLEEAATLLGEALPVSRELGDQENVIRSTARLADLNLRLGKLDEAEASSRDAETQARKWGLRKGQADALMVRAGVMRARENTAEAERLTAEALRLYAILHDPLAAELAPSAAEAR